MGNKKKEMNTTDVAANFLTIKGRLSNNLNKYPKTEQKQTEHSIQKPTKIKGQKLPRINIAFTHENLDYLQRISKIKDISITQYVNNLIKEDLNIRLDDLKEVEKTLSKAKKILGSEKNE